MPDKTNETSQNSGSPVVGDGVSTIPHEDSDTSNKVETMDLPQGVLTTILNETALNGQNNNRQGRDTFTMANGALQAGIAKTLNELGPVESRAVSGVMATPVAYPTVPQSGGTAGQ